MADAYADLLHAARQRPPRAALILGSGLSRLADGLNVLASAPYPDVPGMSSPSVPGHHGRLSLVEWSEQAVLVFAGRLHRYEGHPWRRVVQPIHVARELGAGLVILTNAAGGIRDDLAPGTLMLLRDHIDATQPGWWRYLAGLEAPAASPYSVALFARLRSVGRLVGLDLSAGVYAQVPGPCYETKVEIRALRRCGADAVGMSTAREAETAVALGLQCGAISCITNRAAGLCEGPINHDEVLQASAKMQEQLAQLLGTFFATTGRPLTRWQEKQTEPPPVKNDE
jgi:purine-nucleoside phosphorylase